MIKRKAESRINQWLKEGRNALLVSGARQVGKTYIIRECLTGSGRPFTEFNLIESPGLVSVFSESESVDDLMINLTAITKNSFTPGETILFIDEVQECPDIITKIKFWVDDGRYRFIMSGSLLGIELTGLRSAPVGYLDEVEMFPLDFEEFLLASDVPAESIGFLRESFEREKPINEAVHKKMMTHFARFLVVGGMPAAVSEYITSGDIGKVSNVQRNILQLYKRDFTKYEKTEKKLMLISVFDQIPSNLLRQNKRFQYADLKKGLRFEQVENSFLWLSAAGVAIPVYNATEPRVALNQNKKSSLLKLYMSDVGLLTIKYDDSIRYNILMGEGTVNLGGIFENAVAQELNSHGFDSYFYNSHKNGELDFLVETGGRVVPIEVKSGKDYYVHSALSKALDNQEYDIKKAYVFGDCNISVEDKVRYMPVYMCAFLRKERKMPILEKIL